MNDEAMMLEIARRVRDAGGRALLVGGYVRDHLLGIPGKDIDIEVYGIPPERLRALLAELGEPYDKGASFCVLGLRHFDLDIAMPRLESLSGVRHTDFDVSVDPFLSYEQASRRRDFTINAMMLDPLTGEIIDCWHGREDLARRVIRHVSDETFGDDPLRVFRAAQFAARLNAEIAPETVAISRALDVTHLTRERILEELSKALLKSDRPSVFFRSLEAMGQLRPFFAELSDLPASAFAGCLSSADAAAALRPGAREPLNFMLAALLLPFAEPAGLGEKAAMDQLARLTNNVRTLRYVQNALRLCDKAAALFADRASAFHTRMLLDGSACPEDLARLALVRLDGAARGEAERYFDARVADWRARASQPMVTGDDLIAAGYKPGRRMKDMLDRAKQLHFMDVPPDEAMDRVRAEYPLP